MTAGHEVSSTGLRPSQASALAYVAGPLSGFLLLIVERRSRPVRFHAWQSVLGLGGLAVVAGCSLLLAFGLLILSPTAFWTMIWIAAATSVVWLLVWALCLLRAWQGQQWKLPLAGAYAERLASR
jgi:uncharacterized membrane protein